MLLCPPPGLRFAPSFVATLGLLALPALASPPTLTLAGTGDPAIDRPALQAAIDGASPGTVLELSGMFQLDGERVLITTSHLTLQGVSLDNDADGSFDEDWADGIDNDGDGAVDEDDWDTVLRGVADGNGEPERVSGQNALWNRGLVVEGITGTVVGPTIRGLRFSTFQRAVAVVPEWGTPTGGCGDRFFTGGKVQGLALEDNRFDNNVLGSLVLGDVAGARVLGNVYEDSSIGGFFVEGTSVPCPLAGGGSFDLTLGTPIGSLVENNLFVSGGVATANARLTQIRDNTFRDGTVAVLSLRGELEIIRDNILEDAFAGIALQDTTRSLVAGNSITGSLFPVDLAGAGGQTAVLHTRISGGVNGLSFAPGASGYLAAGLEIQGTFFEAVLLEAGTSGNTVLHFGDPLTALDLGTDNKLIGNFVP